jgi:hypothetical protein
MPRRRQQRVCLYCNNALPKGMHRCTCTVTVQYRPRVRGRLPVQRRVLGEVNPNIPLTSREERPLKRPRLTEDQQSSENPVQLLLQPGRRHSSADPQQASLSSALPRHSPSIDPLERSVQPNPPPNPPAVYNIDELIRSQPHHSDADDIESSQSSAFEPSSLAPTDIPVPARIQNPEYLSAEISELPFHPGYFDLGNCTANYRILCLGIILSGEHIVSVLVALREPWCAQDRAGT